MKTEHKYFIGGVIAGLLFGWYFGKKKYDIATGGASGEEGSGGGAGGGGGIIGEDGTVIVPPDGIVPPDVIVPRPTWFAVLFAEQQVKNKPFVPTTTTATTVGNISHNTPQVITSPPVTGSVQVSSGNVPTTGGGIGKLPSAQVGTYSPTGSTQMGVIKTPVMGRNVGSVPPISGGGLFPSGKGFDGNSYFDMG